MVSDADSNPPSRSNPDAQDSNTRNVNARSGIMSEVWAGADTMLSYSVPEKRLTLRNLKQWVKDRETFAMLTCYDATSAKHLYAGGIRFFLVGDTAAEMLLGHDSTLPVSMEFMLEITAAVRRGAPNALIMADMPFGSYQSSHEAAIDNAIRFLKEANADLVKLEVDASHAELVGKMVKAGIPVVAHIGSRPQQVRAEGGYRSAGRTRDEADELVKTTQLMARQEVAAILVEAVPDEVAREIVDHAANPETGEPIPVIGCGAGPHCHGHIVVMHDVLGLTQWQPKFAPPMADLAAQIREGAARWKALVNSGEYLRDGGVYKMKP